MISTHPAREIRATISSTYPRQRVADEHVYHAGAAEAGVHDDHARRFLAHFADDLSILPTLDAAETFQGGFRLFLSYHSEELAFVRDVERIYAKDLTRPVHHVPDRELLLPERDAESGIAGQFVQDGADTTTSRVPHETQSRTCGVLERPREGSEGPGVGEDFGFQFQVAARDQDRSTVISQCA